jgi:hypothetical protein
VKVIMGKSTGRKNYTTPNKAAAANVRTVHVNDPARRPAPSHDTVRRSTRARLGRKASEIDKALPDATVKAKQISKPINNLDQFGNPLSPNNDSFFDGGAEAQ